MLLAANYQWLRTVSHGEGEEGQDKPFSLDVIQ